MSKYFNSKRDELYKNYFFKYTTKEDKLDFIRKFSKITVSSICNDLGIDRSNLYRNITSERNIDLVYKEIIRRTNEIL